ncbi:MAG: acyl-CoA dehydrogenase family protein [Chloroflexi bacterium]|nr:acyl-CoA dehydrogenase family protein [Chloroflexota bacterium]
MSGYQLPQELRMLQATVRKIIAEEIVPLERTMDPEAIELPKEDYDRLSQKAKAAGLWCLGEPAEYGGGGLNCFAMTVVSEEMAQHRNGLYGPAYNIFGPSIPPIPPIIYSGTKEQIQKFAIPAIRDGSTTFFALTEPSGGADPARAVQTKAVREGDGWVLDGVKIFITGADTSAWGVLFARTSPWEKGKAGLTCFIIEKGMPGFSTRLVPVIRPWYPCEITLQDCRVPAGNVLGEVGAGFELAGKFLGKGRLTYSAANLGVAVAAQRLAIEYSKQRSVFGEALSRKQAVQWMLADSDVEIRATRWLVWEGAWKLDRGEDYHHEASVAKLYSSEVLGSVVDRAVQIHGGYGVSKELPLERWYREARIRRIGEGPSEVHRMVISRDLLRG